MRLTRAMRRLSAWCAIGVAAGIAGCGNGEAQSGEPKIQATYIVRGEVVLLPTPDSAFKLHHEPISDFRDAAGDVVGMDAMVMEFQLDDRVSLEDIAPGDKVRVVMQVWWEPRPGYKLTNVTKLDPETKLDLGGHDEHHGHGEHHGHAH